MIGPDRLLGFRVFGMRTDKEKVVERPPTPWFSIAVATGGGVGFLPLAPGTWGSIVGVLLFLGFSWLGVLVYLPLILLLSLLGVWASDQAEFFFQKHDDGRIVIDEVVGQLLTLTPLIPLRPPGDLGLQNSGGFGVFYALVVTGFVAFRVLDMWKPGVVRWADKNVSGGWA